MNDRAWCFGSDGSNSGLNSTQRNELDLTVFLASTSAAAILIPRSNNNRWEYISYEKRLINRTVELMDKRTIGAGTLLLRLST